MVESTQRSRELTNILSRVDLHAHTAASDGSLTSKELVAQAARLGIQVLAITDHDTTAGLSAALVEAQRWEITVVPGVEISTVSGREEIHLLGYLIDPAHVRLEEMLACTRQARWERAEKMLERLAGLGLPIEWERVVEISGGSASIGRPHVAASLLEAGYVNSFDEAFNVWIGRGRPAYVERYKLSPEAAIGVIRDSGGIAVLAHPYLFARNGECKAGLDLKRWLPRLRDAGLEGIEVYYPHYSHRVNRHLLTWAVQYGLLITGGSDYHGRALANGLGSVAVPWAAWEGLQRRHGSKKWAVT